MSQFSAKTVSARPADLSEKQQLQAKLGLIVDLQAAAAALMASIEVEEEAASRLKPVDPKYSLLAASMRDRLRNIQRTIAMLEGPLKTEDQAA